MVLQTRIAHADQGGICRPGSACRPGKGMQTIFPRMGGPPLGGVYTGTLWGSFRVWVSKRGAQVLPGDELSSR